MNPYTRRWTTTAFVIGSVAGLAVHTTWLSVVIVAASTAAGFGVGSLIAFLRRSRYVIGEPRGHLHAVRRQEAA